LATITGVPATENPIAEEVQAFMSQLQNDRHFGQIRKEWIDKLSADGISLIDQIGNVIIRLETKKDNISSNQHTLATERARCEECVSLLKMIIQMKSKEAVEAKILKKGNEPLFEWLQGMQFKMEMIKEAEEGLKEIENKVKRTQDRAFELMKGLHYEPQTSGQGKALIGIEVMKNNSSVYLSNLSSMASYSQNRVAKLQTLGGCIHVVTEELIGQVNSIKELAREHSRWLLRFTNVHLSSNEELIPIIVAARAYKAKIEKGKKSK
jgi:hypothetical protein